MIECHWPNLQLFSYETFIFMEKEAERKQCNHIYAHLNLLHYNIEEILTILNLQIVEIYIFKNSMVGSMKTNL